MQKILKITAIIDRVSHYVAKISMLFLWILCFLVFSLAVALNFSLVSSKLDDFSLYCFALMILLSFSYTLKENKHVRLDLVYMRYSQKTKLWSWFVVNCFFILPFCAVIMKYGYDFAWQSYNISESSPNGGIPYYFIFKSFVVWGFFFLGLQALSEGLKALVALINPNSNPTLNL